MMKVFQISTVIATLLSLTACTDILVSEGYYVPPRVVHSRHVTVTTTSGHIHNYPYYRAAPPRSVTRVRRTYVTPVPARHSISRARPHRVTVTQKSPSRVVVKKRDERHHDKVVTGSHMVTRHG